MEVLAERKIGVVICLQQGADCLHTAQNFIITCLI